MRVLKRREFDRWQQRQRLPDSALCRAVEEMSRGLVDADLGGLLYKKRVARPGQGKSGGFRTVLSARLGERYVFLHGFAKSEKGNITPDERRALQFVGKLLLALGTADLATAVQAGVILEVRCGEQTH